MLTTVDGSVLQKTFSRDHGQKEIDEEIFLDRDPRIFEMLLNYLRHDRKYIPAKVDPESLRLFELELKHWGVASADYFKAKLPQELIDLLESEPEIEKDSEKQ